MPLLLTLFQFMIGAAILVGLAMFILPVFFVIIGFIALSVIGMGIYRNYFVPKGQGQDSSSFYHNFSSKAPPRHDDAQDATIIEGDYKVVDDKKKKS